MARKKTLTARKQKVDANRNPAGKTTKDSTSLSLKVPRKLQRKRKNQTHTGTECSCTMHSTWVLDQVLVNRKCKITSSHFGKKVIQRIQSAGFLKGKYLCDGCYKYFQKKNHDEKSFRDNELQEQVNVENLTELDGKMLQLIEVLKNVDMDVEDYRVDILSILLLLIGKKLIENM